MKRQEQFSLTFLGMSSLSSPRKVSAETCIKPSGHQAGLQPSSESAAYQVIAQTELQGSAGMLQKTPITIISLIAQLWSPPFQRCASSVCPRYLQTVGGRNQEEWLNNRKGFRTSAPRFLPNLPQNKPWTSRHCWLTMLGPIRSPSCSCVETKTEVT